MAEAYVIDAVRTPVGKRGGSLSTVHSADLGAHVIKALMLRTGVDPGAVEDVIFGCCDTIGSQSGDIARTCWLAAGLPEHVPGVTIDRQCGSSQQALHFAAQAVMAGSMDLVIAGGVESMTRVPLGASVALAKQAGMGGYMSPAMKQRYGDIVFSQFDGAEMLATNYGFDRAALDAYSLESHRRAAAATRSGYFADEVLPVPVRLADGGGEGDHAVDEGIRFDASPESIGSVKLLREGGAISAASASQICDGASAVLVASERAMKSLGATPLARIHHLSVLGHDPVIMLEAPIPATALALRKAGLKLEDIDLFEVNEAFASVPLAWLKATGADPARLNVHGGAIALGHPLGASGTKLATTLLHALRRRGGRYGLQTMCEGGGMANVTIFEALH